MKESISSRQTAIIASILMFANKILTLPSLLFEKAKGDAFLIVIFMFLLDFGVLFIFFKLKQKYINETFFNILSKKLTRPVAIFIYIVILTYFFIEVSLNFNVTSSYFKTQVYHDDQKYVFMILILSIVGIATIGGLRGIARSCEFFFFPILFGFILCLGISIFNFTEPLVIFDTDIKTLGDTIYRYMYSFGDIIVLFILMDKMEYNKESKRILFNYVFITMLFVLCGYFLFLSIFSNTGFMHKNAVSDIIILSPEIFSLGRLDIIAVTTIMILTFCQCSVYGYIICFIIKNLLSKLSIKVCLLIDYTIFLIIYSLFFNTVGNVLTVVTGWGVFLALFVQYVLPLISLCCLIGGRKNAKIHQ